METYKFNSHIIEKSKIHMFTLYNPFIQKENDILPTEKKSVYMFIFFSFE